MTAEDRGQTVLVTGGSGFLGGWCVIELLRRGYTVRTTVRSLSREPQVRAAVGSEVDPGDRLTVLAADLTGDEGGPRRSRAATTSSMSPPCSRPSSRRTPTS